MFCSVTITILIHCSFILPIMFIIEVTSVAWNLGLFSRFTENIGQRIYENTPNESCKDTLICYVKFKRITAFFGKLNWAVRTVQFTTDNTVFIYTWEFIPEIYCPQLVLINKPKQKKNKEQTWLGRGRSESWQSLHTRDRLKWYFIFTVASFRTKNSLNQPENGAFIYTIARLKFICYATRNILVCIKIWQWVRRNALIRLISVLRETHAPWVQRLVINTLILKTGHIKNLPTRSTCPLNIG